MKTTTAKLAAACTEVQKAIAKLEAITGDLRPVVESAANVTSWLLDTIEYYESLGKPGPITITVKGDQLDFTMPAKGLPTDEEELCQLFQTDEERLDVRGKTVTVTHYLGEFD